MSSDTAARAKAAVIGGFVADAATMGLHWIYDLDKLAGVVAANGRTAGSCEFMEPPSCPFYTYEAGALSPYGDEALAVLQYLAQAGQMDGPGFTEFLAGYYKAYGGRLNHSSKTLVTNWEAGKRYPEAGDDKDSQANAFVKVPPIVAAYAGRPELAAVVEAAVRSQQNNQSSVDAGVAAALILEKVVLGSTIAQALEWAAAEGHGVPGALLPLLAAARAEAAGGKTFPEVVKTFGSSCALPGALQNAVAGAEAFAGRYAEGVRANIMAGGDNCSRSVLLGALLAAEGGAAAVPPEWAAKTTRFAEIEALAAKLVA